MSYSNVSKSTKRRRFLEDVETINFLVENQQSQVSPQPSSTSRHTESNLTINVQNESLIDIDSNFSMCDTTFIVPKYPLPSYDFSNDNHNILFNVSSSDSDDDQRSTTNLNKISNDSNDSILPLLSKWAVDHNITLTALSSLLKVLKVHDCFKYFPVDARTVLKTKNNSQHNTHTIVPVQPGFYYHFGIANGLKSDYNLMSILGEKIKLIIGIDGLPLTKSSSSMFWPILGYARYSGKPRVFLIGLYWGREKPHSSNLYLKNLVDELKYLSVNGMVSDFGKKYVTVDTICCDAPAKSFILYTKGHTGYYSCSRCTVEGERVNNTMCFLGSNFPKRTHMDFLNRIDDEHHIGETVSILTEIPQINMIDNFSMDYMHLVCLGIVKKLISLWLGIFKKAPVQVRLQSRDVNIISNHLLYIKSSIPCDFSRKPRGLNEVARWKATEFRLFLLYTGPVVLKGILSKDCFLHFICLHVAFRIILSSNSSKKLVDFSEKILLHFVEKFEELYGAQFVSHNVHGLLHVVDDYRKFGCLDKCSCFPFENYMKFLKKMIRKHEKPLEQVINRYQEFMTYSESKLSSNISNEVIYKKIHNNGPLLEHLTAPQYQIIIKNNVKINTKSISDNYIGFEDDKKLLIFKVFNICHNSVNGRNVFLVRQFKHVEYYYLKPINSLKLGIAYVNNLSEEFTTVDIDLTNFFKYIVLCDSDNKNIAFPILHSNDT